MYQIPLDLSTIQTTLSITYLWGSDIIHRYLSTYVITIYFWDGDYIDSELIHFVSRVSGFLQQTIRSKIEKVCIYIVSVPNENRNSVGRYLNIEESISPFLYADNGVSNVEYFRYDRHVFVRVLEKFELFSHEVKCFACLNVLGV